MTLAPYALATYATVKDALGLPDDTRQTVVELLISAASGAIARECKHDLHFTAGIIERIAGRGVNKLMLSRTPVRAIQRIATLFIDQSPAYVFPANTYDFAADSGIVTRVGWNVTGSGFPWSADPAGNIEGSLLAGSERRSIEVIYDGGWITPPQADTVANGGLGATRDLPYELELACIQTVAAMWPRFGSSTGISSITLHESSVSYDTQGNSIIPRDVVGTLRSFTRVV